MNVYTSNWKEHFAYLPIKLTTGQWVWWKSFFTRQKIVLTPGGFHSTIEIGNLFYVMSHTEKGVANGLFER